MWGTEIYHKQVSDLFIQYKSLKIVCKLEAVINNKFENGISFKDS